MKTMISCLAAVSLMAGVSSCSYHEHEVKAPPVTTQTTTAEVTRVSPGYTAPATTVTRESRTLY